MKRTYILGFDGTSHYKICSVTQAKAGDIYVGYAFSAGEDVHQSFHSDGRKHFKLGGQYIGSHIGLKPSDVRTQSSLMTIAGPVISGACKLPICDAEKIKRKKIIDFRVTRGMRSPNCFVSLVKPGKLKEVMEFPFFQRLSQRPHILEICEEFNPWVIFFVAEGYNGESGPQK